MPAIAETGCGLVLPAQGLHTGCAFYRSVSLYKVRLTPAKSGSHEALHTSCESTGTRKENRHQNRRVDDRCGSAAGHFHTSACLHSRPGPGSDQTHPCVLPSPSGIGSLTFARGLPVMALSLQVAKVPCGHLVVRVVAATLASVTVESPTPSGGELERLPCRSAQVARPCDVRRDHTEGQCASFDSNPSGRLHLTHLLCSSNNCPLSTADVRAIPTASYLPPFLSNTVRFHRLTPHGRRDSCDSRDHLT
jgi:hypothetical protein